MMNNPPTRLKELYELFVSLEQRIDFRVLDRFVLVKTEPASMCVESEEACAATYEGILN